MWGSELVGGGWKDEQEEQQAEEEEEEEEPVAEEGRRSKRARAGQNRGAEEYCEECRRNEEVGGRQ